VFLAILACGLVMVASGCGSDDEAADDETTTEAEASASTAQRDDPAANIARPPAGEVSESEPDEGEPTSESLESQRVPAAVREDSSGARAGTIRPSCSDWYTTNQNTYEKWCIWRFDAGWNFQVYYYYGTDRRWHPYRKCWWPRGTSQLTCDSY